MHGGVGFVTNINKIVQFFKKILLKELTSYNFSWCLRLTDEIFYRKSFIYLLKILLWVLRERKTKEKKINVVGKRLKK